MQTYSAKNAPMKGLKGVACTLGIIAAVLADSLVCRLLGRVLPDAAAALLFWLVGMLIAWWTLRIFVRGYNYVLTGTALRISTAYAKYERLLEEVYLNTLVSAGKPEDVMKHHPDAGLISCVLERCEEEPFAIAFTREKTEYIYVIQLPGEMRQKLTQIAQKNRKS